MNKSVQLIILLGFSATGKDTLLKEILTRFPDQVKSAVSYTTRPIRDGETEGIEYYFMTEEEYMAARDMVLNERAYDTFQNGTESIWYYGLPYDEVNGDSDSITIVDFEGSKSILEKLGCDKVKLIYLTVPEQELYERNIARGDEQKEFVRRPEDDKIQFQGVLDAADLVLDNSVGNFEKNIESIQKFLGY